MWSDWTNWTKCSQECGSGHQNRTRLCDNPAPVNSPACNGTSIIDRNCSYGPCPIDGNWTEWTIVGSCNVSCGGGLQLRIRNCTNPEAQHNGTDCDGSSDDQVICNVNECPIDGNWTFWSDWNECNASCGGGSYNRSRRCSDPSPEYGGDNCTGHNWESEICNSDPCPVDGGWMDWTVWGPCNTTCDGGTQQRYRECNNPYPEHGGSNCTGEHYRLQQCNNNHCPVDGNWTSWSTWGECDASCDGGSMMRTRSCSEPEPAYHGAECDGDNSEVGECHLISCPVDGGYSEWSSWSSCSVTCGLG